MGGSPVWHRPTPQREEPFFSCVGHAAASAGTFAYHHIGTIVTVLAIGVCLIPSPTLVACGVANGLAFLARAYQRHESGVAYLSSQNLIDGLTTGMALGYGSLANMASEGGVVPGVEGEISASDAAKVPGYAKWVVSLSMASPDMIGLGGSCYIGAC